MKWPLNFPGADIEDMLVSFVTKFEAQLRFSSCPVWAPISPTSILKIFKINVKLD